MSEKSSSTLGLGHVVDNSLQQLAKLGFLACIIAWGLTLTSHSLLINLPIAAFLIVLALWVATHFQIEPVTPQKPRRRGGVVEAHGSQHGRVPATPFAAVLEGLAEAGTKAGKSWQEQVGSGVVESAWETLCGSILQEFIYDMWYGGMTPDKEFPREIRRVLNTAFGTLAARARKSNLKGMLLRDMSELIMDQIELYRETRESIAQGLEAGAWHSLPHAARDRALLAELKAEGNLHPALFPADETSPDIIGHYKVLQTVCEGIVAFLLERSDHSKVMMRSVARELLATCVFRPLMGLVTPYNINKMVLHSLQKSVEKHPLDVEEVAAAAEAKVARPDAAKGNWDFAERARQSIQQEEGASVARSDRARRQRTQGSLDKPLSNSALLEAKPSASANKIKRVKSENSLQPPSSAAHPDASSQQAQQSHRAHNAISDARAKDLRDAARLRSGSQASTSGEAAPEQLPGSQGNFDAGNVMGMPATTAQWRSKGGFIGRPRARVVAAELNTEGSKDIVIYKIRVADSTGEWTVSRRFRNFESLQRTLKELPGYRIRMPAKRVFTHSQNVEFVEERRQQLDIYLQQILADSSLTGRMEVWEFLSAWSDLYGLDCDQSLLGTINATFKEANVNMRRAMGDIVEDLDAKRKKANASLSKLASTNLPQAALGTFADLDSMRIANRQEGYVRLPPSRSTENPAAPTVSKARAGTPGVGGVRTGQPGPGVQKLLATDIQTLVPSLFSKGSPMKGSSSGARSSAAPAPVTFADPERPEEFRGSVLRYHKATDGRSKSERLLLPVPGGTQAPQRADSGTAPVQNGVAALEAVTNGSSRPRHQRSNSDPFQATAAEVQKGRSGEANTAETPPKQQTLKEAQAETPQTSASATLDSGHIQLSGPSNSPSTLAATQNMEAVPPAVIPSSLAQVTEDRSLGPGGALDESAGISAPLYDVVDVLFQLQSRGFFRRQVYGVARQMLSLVAGGAIDDYILSQLRALRQEHQLARLIHSLQISLWPGGLWFQRLPERQAAVQAQPQSRFVMTPSNYLRNDGPAPLDADEIMEAVQELLMSSAPPALIRVIGRTAYQAGMQDLYDMMQSQTFVHQLGYGILRIVLVNLIPELRPLFRSIEKTPPDMR